MSVINTNIQSLQAKDALAVNNRSLTDAMQKLPQVSESTVRLMMPLVWPLLTA